MHHTRSKPSKNRSFLRFFQTAAVVFSFLLPNAPATATVSACSLEATVRDESRAAIPGAVVTLLPGELRATTDRKGHLELPAVPTGRYNLLAVAEGFAVAGEGIDCVAEDKLELAVTLAPAFGEELVVSANRTARRLAEVPVHIQTVGRQAIESSAARTLADAVEFTPGIRVESNCQSCNFSQVRLLGLEGPYSQILVDGQPTVSSLAMVYGVEQFPARLLDGVEIVKGGGSAIYGAGAVGGVINLLPHQPDHTAATVEIRSSRTHEEPGFSGSGVLDWVARDHTRTVSAFGQVDDLGIVDVDGDGFSEVSRRELASYGLRFDQFLLESSGRLAGEANLTQGDRRGGEVATADLPPDRSSLAEDISTERLGASLSWLHTPSARLDYRVSASFADTRRDSYYGADFDPNAYGRTNNPLWVGDLQANHALGKGTFTWGAQHSQDEIDDIQPGYGREIRETYTTTSLYLQDDRKAGDRVTVLYGLRGDQHSELAHPILSPRLAVMWSPRTNLTIRSSLARGFRAPTVFDEDLHIELLGGGAAKIVTNDANLREETSTAYLLSTEWRPTFRSRGSASLELSFFRTELDDLFFAREADDLTTPELEFLRTNLGGALVQGIEASASVRWGSRFMGEMGFVSQTARFEQPEPDFGSQDFFRTPKHHGNLTLQWRFPKWADLFVGALYTGPMKAPHYAGFVAEDRLETTPSFLTVDLNLSRAVALGGEKEITLTVGVKNLTDQFQEDLDQGANRDSAYVYGPRFPRSLFLGAKLDL